MNEAELRELIAAPEGDHLECKEARNRFSFDELADYATGLANAGGGVILLGVSDQRPRRIIGTAAFTEPGQQAASLFERLGLHVSVSEHLLQEGRVLAFSIPSRRRGYAINHKGRYLIRVGESLLSIADEQLKAIHREQEPDFSAELCPGLQISELSIEAIEEFRILWARRSGQDRLLHLDPSALLRDAELIDVSGGVTYAALLLLGTQQAVGQYLPSAEVIYEYRSSEQAGPAQQRAEFRRGFVLASDALWRLIDARNDRQSIQEGFFLREISTFDELATREAVLNAVSHRDYRDPRSTFVRQYARRLEVVSPGGFPFGVTPENILGEQHPRNRRLAESFSKIGLVDRAGQGVNLMVERSVQQGKRPPSFTGTTSREVKVTLDGLVTNPKLLAFLERVGEELLRRFATEDFIILDALHHDQAIPRELTSRLSVLRDLGLLESVGRGRNVRYFLSRRFSVAIGQVGAYTRRRGLDRSTNKELLYQHLVNVGVVGSKISELEEVLPGLSRGVVQGMLQSLRKDGRAILVGSRKGARWFHGETVL